MSAETKKAAEQTKTDLSNAGEYLRRAEESAKKTGDKTLVEKVTKVKEGVTIIKEDLSKKLNEG